MGQEGLTAFFRLASRDIFLEAVFLCMVLVLPILAICFWAI